MCAFGWLGMKAFQEKFERRKAHPVEATSSFPMSLLAKETGCHSLPSPLLPFLSISDGESDIYDLASPRKTSPNGTS